MPPQPPLTQPAYDDLHAILTHYEAKETGLGHRIAHRLRDKLQRGTLDGAAYYIDSDTSSEGCLFCTVVQELGCEARDGKAASVEATKWANSRPGAPRMGWAEKWIYDIRPGMTPATSPAADALDAAIEDWQHIQEATLPAHSAKVVAQGWTPRELAALKAEVHA